MKKILLMFCFILMVFTGYSQVKFMDIPVDGTANVMIQKLKNKGFSVTDEKYEIEGLQYPVLKGQFNGLRVYLVLAKNHGELYRVHLAQINNYDEADIIIEFNNLFNQFYNSSKYLLLGGQKISEKENISYEMICHNKVYEAGFYQILSDDMIEDNIVWFRISEHYGKYYIFINYDNLKNAPNGEDL